jgi:sirohydrochlorin cobaltochelatase
MATTGLILFAHGARDARWREPFERLQRKVQVARPDVAVGWRFSSSCSPISCRRRCARRRRLPHARIVPVFLGQGGHVREDLPAAVEAVRARHPGLDIELRLAIGEDDAVLDQIVITALAGLPK